jgi:sn-glycerol 3-phosphate transport system ATP-binding protein
MVAGLERISSGEISIGGRVVNDLEPKDRDIAMVFQNYALYPHMSVYDNIAYGLRIRGLAKAEIDRKVKEAAAHLEIGELLERKPRQLSGGQRQRVAMGRAIVREPAAFLFDEPLSNLDAKLRTQMRVEIKRLQAQLGVTNLYVTHDQVEAMTLAHRMLVMSVGKTEQIGAPLEVYTRPETTFVAGFIGSPPMNLIPGRLQADGASVAADGDTRLKLPQAYPQLGGRSVLLGVRPEHLEICAPGEALLVPKVDFVELLGSDSLVYGHIGQDKASPRVAARLHASVRPQDGQLPLRFAPENLHFFDPDTGKRIEP